MPVGHVYCKEDLKLNPPKTPEEKKKKPPKSWNFRPICIDENIGNKESSKEDSIKKEIITETNEPSKHT